MSRTLVLGASGFIGAKLFKHLHSQNSNTIGTYNSTPHQGLVKFTLGVDDIEQTLFAKQTFDHLVICCALTNISAISQHPDLAHKINVDATIAVIKAAIKRNMHIVFLSTDNVFNGNEGNYSATDTVSPISEYGKQKCLVEKALSELTTKFTVLRLSKTYSTDSSQSNILHEIANQLLTGETLSAAVDLIFNPTLVTDVVNSIEKVLTDKIFGIHHLCHSTSYSRYQITEMIASKLEFTKEKIDKKINKINFADLNLAGKRALNTSMIPSDCFDHDTFSSLASSIDIASTTWRAKNQ